MNKKPCFLLVGIAFLLMTVIVEVSLLPWQLLSLAGKSLRLIAAIIFRKWDFKEEREKKKQFLVAILLSLGLLIICDSNYLFSEEAIPIHPFDGMMEVLPGVYDDQQNTVYIKVKVPARTREDMAITEIVNKKRKWEDKFPAKKVITWSIVPGDEKTFLGGSYGYTVVVGLLIHYERRQ